LRGGIERAITGDVCPTEIGGEPFCYRCGETHRRGTVEYDPPIVLGMGKGKLHPQGTSKGGISKQKGGVEIYTLLIVVG